MTNYSNMVVVQPHRRVIRSGRVAAARVTLMDGEHTLEKPVRHSAAVTIDARLKYMVQLLRLTCSHPCWDLLCVSERRCYFFSLTQS
eukprot:COSAG02_NODE_18184_length_955_cov_1.296729_1_plen_87_part_00